MRLPRFFVAAAFAVSLAACSGGSLPSSLPHAAAPGGSRAAVARGHVESIQLVQSLTVKQLSKGRGLSAAALFGGAPQCNVTLYSIVYDTIGVHGEAALASAAMYVPGPRCKGPYPLVGYAHGTIFTKPESLTAATSQHLPGVVQNPESIIIAAIYAAHGYVVAATDYLGFGLSNYSYHPYFHADSEASAVIDAMRAVRNAAPSRHVRLSGAVFISGYSQGGHAAMATHRAIEKSYLNEFDLRGSEPASGPYAFAWWFGGALRPQQQGSLLGTFALTGYNKIYGNVYNDPSEIFQAPYDNGIDTLLPLPTLEATRRLFAGKILPLETGALFQAAFLKDYASNASNGARLDAADNDLLQGWSNARPMLLCGGSKDPVVDYRNTLMAAKYFKSLHAPVKILDVNSYMPASVPPSLYHDAVLVICEPLTRASFFDKLKGS